MLPGESNFEAKCLVMVIMKHFLSGGPLFSPLCISSGKLIHPAHELAHPKKKRYFCSKISYTYPKSKFFEQKRFLRLFERIVHLTHSIKKLKKNLQRSTKETKKKFIFTRKQEFLKLFLYFYLKAKIKNL